MRQGPFWGGSGRCSATPRDISKIAGICCDIVCATRQQWCDTKELSLLITSWKFQSGKNYRHCQEQFRAIIADKNYRNIGEWGQMGALEKRLCIELSDTDFLICDRGGKTQHKAPPQHDTFPPPLCPHPVICLRGNVWLRQKGVFPPKNHRVHQGAAQRGAQFYFIIVVLRTLSFMQLSEHFPPRNLHPHEGNPLKHRLTKCMTRLPPPPPRLPNRKSARALTSKVVRGLLQLKAVLTIKGAVRCSYRALHSPTLSGTVKRDTRQCSCNTTV